MKHIVIMGATSGIGLRVAEIYATAGWRVGVAGRKDDVMKELQTRFPKQVEWEHIDITRKDSVTRLENLIKKLGGMDIYFHVSGIGFQNPAVITDEEVATVETNVVGFTRMIDTAFRYFRDVNSRKGHIAAVTSIAGTKGIGELASYSSSKKFQQTYLQALEQLSHMQELDIKFTDIRPGWIRTPLLDPDREYPMTMELEGVVPQIIRALINKTRMVVIDRRWAVGYQLWRMIPERLWANMDIHVSSPATGAEKAENTVTEITESKPE